MEDAAFNTELLLRDVKSEPVCRLCLTEDVFMQPLCLDESENEPLLERIFQFTSVQITSMTGIQQSVCVICKNKIDEYYQFREQCLQNDIIFKANYSEEAMVKIKEEPGLDASGEVEEGDLWNALESVSNEINPESIKINDDTSISLLEKWINKNIGDSRTGLDRELPENKIIQPSCDEHENGSLSMLENWINTNGTNPDVNTNSNPDTSSTPYDDMDIIDPQNYLSVVQYDEPESSTNHFNDAQSFTKKYVCEICQKSFTQSAHLNIHRRIHTGERPFKCHLCEKSFVHGSNLKVHVKSHTGEKPYACEVCERPFSSKQNLRNHMLTHESKATTPPVNVQTHQCPYCEKKCTYMSNLKVHIKTQHYGERPYKCDLCNQLFTNNRNYKIHMGTHDNVKIDTTLEYFKRQFQCPYCEKKCSYRSNLKVHIKSHFGDRPFRCNWCENTYASNQNLKRHLATHPECNFKEENENLKLVTKNCEPSFESLLKYSILQGQHPDMDIKEEIMD